MLSLYIIWYDLLFVFQMQQKLKYTASISIHV